MMSNTKEYLFDQLGEIGLRPGCTKIPDELYGNIRRMNHLERMNNEELRFPIILFYKARHDRGRFTGDADWANLNKETTISLLGSYGSQEIIDERVGLSLEYIPRPGAKVPSGPKLKAGTKCPKTGKMYLPSTAGGKGKFVEPFEYFRDRPLKVLQAAWNGRTRNQSQPREVLIHTSFCDSIITEIGNRFGITFDVDVKKHLSIASYKNRK